ncbi:hypothetical protein [Brevibacillus fluminis]|uniref:hypothetical protein n=1 Tax=Brevibacillus fluminis TaxID=511487 RepID=UPI0011CE6AA8|nr:hypothetical protein [Brevibacillus fluminis]
MKKGVFDAFIISIPLKCFLGARARDFCKKARRSLGHAHLAQAKKRKRFCATYHLRDTPAAQRVALGRSFRFFVCAGPHGPQKAWQQRSVAFLQKSPLDHKSPKITPSPPLFRQKIRELGDNIDLFTVV